jgi:hypothetical protein
MKEDLDGRGPSAFAPERHTTLKGLGAVRPTQSDGSGNRQSESIMKVIKTFTSRLTAQKLVPVTEVFDSLHWSVKRDIVRLCDFSDSPFEFEEQFRFFCENNPLFLPQVSAMLEKRSVKAKVVSTKPAEEGWCVEDSLEKTFDPDTRSDLAIHLSKVSGDESVHPIGTVKQIPLRQVLPFNLKR